MTINPSRKQIAELLNTKYSVDFYQREYKWNDSGPQYTPITSLLDDICYRFDLNYNPTLDVTDETVDKYDWYYLNSIITNSVGGQTYIVDGQQRLTTLTILAIALRKIGITLDAEPGQINFLERRICDFDVNGNKVFWLGFEDRVKALDKIFKTPPGEHVEVFNELSVTAKNIYGAYNIIYGFMSERLSNKHVFNAFVRFLFFRTYITMIEIAEPTDVAMVFEVINDRGLPLQPFEILKGKILGNIEKSELQPYLEKWENTIGSIANKYRDEEINDFFVTYFQSKYNDSNKEYSDLQASRYHKNIFLGDLDKRIGFKRQTTNLLDCIKRIKNFVDNDLPYFGDLYLKLLDDCKDWNAPLLFPLYNYVNDQKGQFYLLLSAVSLGDPFKDEKYELVTREFDRMYVLTNLTGAYNSSMFNTNVIELGRVIRNRNLDEIKAAFNKTLLDIINKAHNRKDIQDPFKFELFSNIGYLDFSARFLRYFFARIDIFIADEAQLSTAKIQKLMSSSRGKNSYHIEHILANDYSDENLSFFNDEDEFHLQRNRLGGLVLLKGRDNQASGNESYKNKLKTYVGSTVFAQTLINSYHHRNKGLKDFCKKYDIEFKTYTRFDRTAIDERQQLLFKLVKIIWD